MSSSDLNLRFGVHVVAAAGTPEPLIAAGSDAEVRCRKVRVKARLTNGGNVYLGRANVDAATPANCDVLDAGEIWEMEVSFQEFQHGIAINLSQLWIDSDVNGEGVSFSYALE